MSRKSVLFALALTFAIGFVAATVFAPAFPARAEGELRSPGRYVIVTNASNAAYTFLLDTEVGLIWSPQRDGDGFRWIVNPREPVN